MTGHEVKFVLDGRIHCIDFDKTALKPSTTVLNYLRSLPHHRGTKEGCAEGDCGACTVVLGELKPDGIAYRAVDSCLLYLPALHGKQLITVENLARKTNGQTELHPVQKAMLNNHGSQCGFCTPGFVMTLFALYKSDMQVSRQAIIHALSGNLCRCTGYEPIYKAALEICQNKTKDHFDESASEVAELLHAIKQEKKSVHIHSNGQRYMLPAHLEEAIHFRTTFPEARLINGATDTAVQQNKTHTYPAEIIDLSGVGELNRMRNLKNGFFLGAGLRIESFKSFAKSAMPELSPMLDVFASWQIRNVATIGGNLATTSPIGDLIPLFIALKARVELISPEEKRWVDMEDFITGYRKNCMKPNELMLGVHFPKLGKKVTFYTEKVSTRRDLDIATLSIAMQLKTDPDNLVEEIILCYGGMADRPLRAIHTEQFLSGKPWNKENLMAARPYIANDFTPISDARSGAAFRLTAAQNLLLKAYASNHEPNLI